MPPCAAGEVQLCGEQSLQDSHRVAGQVSMSESMSESSQSVAYHRVHTEGASSSVDDEI